MLNMNPEDSVAPAVAPSSPEPRSVHFSDSTLLRSGEDPGVTTPAPPNRLTQQNVRELFVEAMTQPWTTLALLLLSVFVTVISIYALVTVVEHNAVMSRMQQETSHLNRRVTEMHASVSVLLQSAPRVVYRVRTPVHRSLLGSFPAVSSDLRKPRLQCDDVDVDELTSHMSSLQLEPSDSKIPKPSEASAKAPNEGLSESGNQISSP